MSKRQPILLKLLLLGHQRKYNLGTPIHSMEMYIIYKKSVINFYINIQRQHISPLKQQ
jgi:hypothetical protein